MIKHAAVNIRQCSLKKQCDPLVTFFKLRNPSVETFSGPAVNTADVYTYVCSIGNVKEV